MAKEVTPPDPKAQQQQAAPAATAAPASGWTIKKILMIGGPILLVQIVAVYFLVVKFFAPSDSEAQTTAAVGEKVVAEEEKPQIVVIKDIIVNPAGTNGSHLLVTSIGLEVSTAETKTELEEKEVQTRDILVTILTGKRMEELSTPEQKENLRKEIHQKIDEILKSSKLKKVYISKFIIQ
jgi:flagellar FliL protein